MRHLPIEVQIKLKVADATIDAHCIVLNCVKLCYFIQLFTDYRMICERWYREDLDENYDGLFYINLSYL